MKTKISRFQVRALTLAIGLGLYGMSGAQTTAVKPTAPTTVKQTETKAVTPDTVMEGTLRSAGVDALVISTTTDPKPLAYRYAKSVQYVDDTGKVLTREVLTPGVPVTVQYVQEGNGLIAQRVTVHQAVAVAKVAEPTVAPAAATTTTTTTTTAEVAKPPTTADGVISRWEPDRFELTTEKSGVIKFLYSQDTAFVDADDKKVTAIRMKSGLPVTVRFQPEGDRLLANKITVNVRTNDKVR